MVDLILILVTIFFLVIAMYQADKIKIKAKSLFLINYLR